MMISSAVIVPQPDDLPPPSPSHKRRQSSASYDGSFKRPRIDTEISRITDGSTLPPSATSPPRRHPSVTDSGAAEERKRGQRLFGALLGTLSQSSTTTAQRRRADIEKRQLGKLQQHAEQLEGEKRRKKEELDQTRAKEQKGWDEQSMRLRHRNKLAEAHFLLTKAEPRLFYKPWELRPEQQEQIKRRIEDAEMAVKAELDEHRASKGSEEAEHGAEEPGKQKDITGSFGQPVAELVGADATNDEQVAVNTSAPEVVPANNEDERQVSARVHEEETGQQEEKTNEDHGGEELVEGQEDDVIY